MTTRKRKPVPCDVCGETVWIFGRQKQHCDTEECGVGYARKIAFERVERVGECDVWQGEVHQKGGAPIIRMNLSDRRRDLRVIALRDPEGESVVYRKYINTCGTPRCVTVEHNRPQIATPTPPSQRILTHLPVEPVDEYVRTHKVVLGHAAHKPLQVARRKGYFTVTGADAFCIDVLGIHPAAIYGDAFYDAA